MAHFLSCGLSGQSGNMTAKTLAEIADAIGYDRALLRQPDLMIDTPLTDSRALTQPGSSLFFALATCNNDGHNYIAPLVASGVRAFVVTHIPDGVDLDSADFIIVNDPLAALMRLAKAHRAMCADTMVIAVGGSRGKTMVKEMLYGALSRVAPSVRSPRSWNSRVGVPLSLLRIDPSRHRYAVIEAGISTRGEMQTLADIIAPDVAVITNVLPGEHDEGFNDLKEKRAEKMKLAQSVGLVVAPTDCTSENDNLRLCKRVLKAIGVDSEVENRTIRTRLDVTEAVNNCLLVSDRFTCDLPSLESALDFAVRRLTASQKRLTLLLDSLTDFNGDDLCRYLALYHIDRFIGIGAEYAEIADRLPVGSIVFQSADECVASLSAADFDSELILAKGEPGGAVDQIAERLRSRHHETVLEVNLDAIIHNFNHFKAMLRPTTGMVAMVKASGYGVGSYELAKTLQSQGAAYLAVAVVDEGEELRSAGITMPIMVLNPKVTNYNSLFANRLEPEVFSFNMLEEIIAEAEKRGISDYPVHIKFDTGMHRLGFLREDIPAIGRLLRSTTTVKAKSIFSHLATADCLDMDQYTIDQLKLFDSICCEMAGEIGPVFLRHILNSAGIARFPEWQYDMVRLGISLYGVDTLGIPETSSLRTVASLRSIIISIKRWPAGTAIGYGRRTILDHSAIVATVPVGYADGLNRHLSNGVGKVMVNGALCPIVGNICMDACMIDVTAAGDSVKVGDSVEFFGDNNPINTMADAVGTIPYEILTSVSPRVKRVYFRE